MEPVYLAILIVAALLFAYLNGFNDASSIVATVISSRAMPPRKALYLVAAGELVGPFLFGVAVASTVGKGLIAPDSLTASALLAGLLSAITWNLFAWYFGLPASSSHALLGGLIGASLGSAGFSSIQTAGLLKIAVSLVATPLLVGPVGFLFMKLLLLVVRNASPKINLFFRRGQLPTVFILSLSHGANDAQKTMGVMVMAMVALGYQNEFHVPLWVIALSAAAISLGAATGGWRIIRTVGGKFYKIRPVHAFSSQTCSAIIILTASLFGGPVSGTQVINSSVLGVGAGERFTKIRWDVAGNMLLAWIITLPITVLLALGYQLFITQFLLR